MSTAEYESDGPSTGELSSAYLECLIAPDARRARSLIEESLAAGISAASLYLEVIDPAMREVGRLWEIARLSVAQEHLATQITQSVIADAQSPAARRGLDRQRPPGGRRLQPR